MLRSSAAIDWLITRIEDAAPPDAAAVVESLATFRHDDALRARVARAVSARDDAAISEAFDSRWHASVAR